MRHLLLLTILILLNACSYLPEDITSPSENYLYKETRDYILLEPGGESSKDGILFIPGGLVDPHAYIPVFEPFVQEHSMKVLLLKVRSNLAIFNIPQAKRVRKDFENDKWLIGGHSLGAVVASFAIADGHLDEYEGLFLMGSYASNDISGYDQPVFSILAENDEVTNMASVEENAINLPEGINAAFTDLPDLGDTHGKTVYYTIKGGNHAQFGSYGIQKGDGQAEISSRDQQREFFKVLSILMRNNDFDI